MAVPAFPKGYPSPKELVDYLNQQIDAAKEDMITANTMESVRYLQGVVAANKALLKELSRHNRA